MANQINGIGFCADLLIHPGETLLEAMEDRGVSQSELARRTGVSEKHISRVVNGKDNVTAAFALSLEYALGIEARFWINLQAQYDEESVRAHDVSAVDSDEMMQLKSMPETLSYLKKLGLLRSTDLNVNTLVAVRKLLKLRNLSYASKCLDNSAYRNQQKIKHCNPCALLAWERLCEMQATNNELPQLDVKGLQNSLPEFKKSMFLDSCDFVPLLEELLAKVGVSFQVAPVLDGISVYGLAKILPTRSALVAVAVEHETMACFWLTFFHELAHIVLGDAENGRLDFPGETAIKEIRANRWAEDALINREELKVFRKKGDFSSKAVAGFAESQSVPTFIVEDRLERENIQEAANKPRYEWHLIEFGIADDFQCDKSSPNSLYPGA